MQLPNPSVAKLWANFVQQYPKYKNTPIPNHFYFCDNEQDANTCADLVVKKIKQATATSLWWYEYHGEPRPNIGDLYIVTDWEGSAKAIIELIAITHVPFNEVGADFAEAEGEGDKSLGYWRKVHKAYYQREMEAVGARFKENMMISCERFRTVFTFYLFFLCLHV